MDKNRYEKLLESENEHTRKLDLLMVDQMKNLFEVQKAQLEMLEDLKEKLDKKPG